MFGIGEGVTGQEQSQYNNLTAGSAFATSQGEGDLTASSDFMRGLLSGDPTKVAQALAPQISAIRGRNEQAKDTTAQFGNRSGGSTATVAGIDTAGRSDITNLTGSATNAAASSLASTGTALTGLGLEGDQAGFGEAKTMQEQQAAKWNDILKSIASFAAAPFTGGASLSGVIPGIGGKTGGGNPAPDSLSWMLGPHA